MDWQEAVGRLAGGVARQLGGDRPARVVVYRGYGTDRVAHVRGRVLAHAYHHTLEAAHHAAHRGWIEPRDVAAVAQDREREVAEADM